MLSKNVKNEPALGYNERTSQSPRARYKGVRLYLQQNVIYNILDKLSLNISFILLFKAIEQRKLNNINNFLC